MRVHPVFLLPTFVVLFQFHPGAKMRIHPVFLTGGFPSSFAYNFVF
jgi:hypothetical protein